MNLPVGDLLGKSRKKWSEFVSELKDLFMKETNRELEIEEKVFKDAIYLSAWKCTLSMCLENVLCL